MISLLLQFAQNAIRRLNEDRKSLASSVSKVCARVLQTLCAFFFADSSHVIAFVPQLVQEEPCKFSFVSSTLTEGFDPVTQWSEYPPFKQGAVGSNPTGVICRLIVQRKEHLASNEKVLGSNPSKAANPSLAQWTEHDATNVGCRKFDSCMRVHVPLAQLVAQVPYKNEVERSSRSRNKNCIVAQLVERPAVNGIRVGSNPTYAATLEAIRIGKGPVLKTGATKVMQVRVHAASACTTSSMVEQMVDNRSVLGSNPRLCPNLPDGFVRRKLRRPSKLGVVHQQNARLGHERHQGQHLALRPFNNKRDNSIALVP